MKYYTYIVTGLFIIVSLFLTAFLFASYLPLQEKLKTKEREIRETRSLLDKTTIELEDTKRKIEDLSKTEGKKSEEISNIEKTYNELIEEMKKEIEDGKIEISTLREELTVNVLDQILFDSGKIEIKPEGLEVLGRVGNIIKGVEDHMIVVEGHTDNVPISPALSKRFPTNWELSAARATNVVRYLQEYVGVDPKRLVASGYSEYHPVDDNATREGKSRNRRIEIILVPIKEK